VHQARSMLRYTRDKRPFNITVVLRRIRTAVARFADAALFELADAGHRSLFEQLLACIISIRTRDEVTLETARQLFATARTPAEVHRLTPEQIDELIHASSFHEAKARQIAEIARRTVEELDGELPCDEVTLTSFKGVGPKCAHLALAIACGQSHIAVDVHVWRVTNRWGYVDAATPELAMAQLERTLPKRYWVEINRLLVPFGKHICTGTLPKCSSCPVLAMCRQVGVTKHR
jgi:endonuclease-3